MHAQYVLIGASAGALGALNKLMSLDPQASIIIITAEPAPLYNKCLLADYLADSALRSRALLALRAHAKGEILYDTRVISLNAGSKELILDSMQKVTYEKLLIATGSSPFVPPIAGLDGEGIFTFHTLQDIDAITEHIVGSSGKKVAIIGAGLSGVEAADALAKRGCHVTIIERSSTILGSLLEPQATDFLMNHIRSVGVTIFCNTIIERCENTADKKYLYLQDGKRIEADIVIVATGLRPNWQLAKDAGLATDEYGIVVNEYLQTSSPSIWAVGDVISCIDQLTGKRVRSCTWPDAMLQGLHAAHSMAGSPKIYVGPSLIVSSSFFGLKMASAGSLLSGTHGIKKGQGGYYRYDIQHKILRGFTALGTHHDLGQLRRLLLAKAAIEDPSSL